MSKHRLAKFTGAIAGTIAGILTKPDDEYLSMPDQIRVLEKRISDLERDNHDLLAFRNGQDTYNRKLHGFLQKHFRSGE